MCILQITVGLYVHLFTYKRCFFYPFLLQNLKAFSEWCVSAWSAVKRAVASPSRVSTLGSSFNPAVCSQAGILIQSVWNYMFVIKVSAYWSFVTGRAVWLFTRAEKFLNRHHHLVDSQLSGLSLHSLVICHIFYLRIILKFMNTF